MSSATWAASQGVSFEVAEICLAHAGEELQKAYQRSDILGERRKVMERWSKFLSGEDHETEHDRPKGCPAAAFVALVARDEVHADQHAGG